MSELRSDEPWTAPSLQPIDFINDCITYGAFAAPYLPYMIDALKHHNVSTIMTSRAQLIGCLGPFNTYANHRAFYRIGLIEPILGLRSHLDFEMDGDIVGIDVGRSFHSQRHRVLHNHNGTMIGT
ncbi:hypothetical protein CCUS01_03001 [Colletotrichum cuscutae]|uniref:Uncharacterized protein n=1 Tax=Colletotrichum cuscutae TaxID=1209917 RepID=A0AAI9YAY2_9PEZI|nr:hypothetical protein CCUS01_03001 [Colletotrichum cuscutae]